MSHRLLLRVDRVEHWRPPHADGGPILTTIEVHDANEYRLTGRVEGPSLRFEHQGEGYTPTRLVLNFPGEVRDFAPGDYLSLAIEKAAPPERDPDDVPF